MGATTLKAAAPAGGLYPPLPPSLLPPLLPSLPPHLSYLGPDVEQGLIVDVLYLVRKVALIIWVL